MAMYDNLLANVRAHTAPGTPARVSVQRSGRWAEVIVADEGPGIPPQDQTRVFERFWRAPGSASGGTGLGLAIAKSIVDLHGGRITVSNRAEGGARFTVRIPGTGGPPIGAAEPGSALAAEGQR